jgi:hypothetical protein
VKEYWFQAFAFTWVNNLYRYDEGIDDVDDDDADEAEDPLMVGLLQVDPYIESAWFQTFTP